MPSCWRILIGITTALIVSTFALVLLFEPERNNHASLPQKLQPFRPLPIRIGNAMSLFLKSFDIELIPLDANDMIEAACAKHKASTNTSECDFGIARFGDFRPSFSIFVKSLNEEASLTLIGRVFASHRASMLLLQRLQMIHHWKEHPVDHHVVHKPLFVVGLPRTGTTFLHTLLAQDTDNLISPLNWMVVNPMPPQFGYISEDESTASGARKALIDDANYNLDQFKAIAKDVDAQHVMNAFAPEKCIVFQAHTFVAFEFLTYFTLPSYSNWLRDFAYPGSEYNQAFKWHKHVLQHMLSVAPATAMHKSWVLKTPFHMGMLDDLIDVYPDANIIMTHRRPVRALTSLSSLQVKLRTVATDVIKPKEFAQEFIGLHSEFAGRAVDTRKKWKKEGRKNVLDVSLHSLHSDPMKVVASIYKKFGMTLSSTSKEKMLHWLKNDGQKGKHGSNVYDPQWFGLENQEEILKNHPQLKKYDDYYCNLFGCE